VQNDYEHIPVLLQEVLNGLSLGVDGVLVDGTFGRGGHTRELLKRLGPEARVIGIDRDPQAVAAGQALAEQDSRLTVIRATFSAMRSLIEQEGLLNRVTGVLLDLGVSSPQLDDASRGFSFQVDGPLDMRMDPDSGISAAQWLQRVGEKELVEVLTQYGEERYARRIAGFLAAERKKRSIDTTMQLAEIVTKASPSRERGKHPATRTFQAIRIYLNRELKELGAGLEAALAILKPGGRLAVISFHSLEDRIVKRFIRDQAHPPPGPFPEAVPPADPTLRPIGKARKASRAECEVNVRARSATLRVAERLQ